MVVAAGTKTASWKRLWKRWPSKFESGLPHACRPPLGHLGGATESVSHPHLLDRAAEDIEQARAADKVCEALGARDRNVQPRSEERRVGKEWRSRGWTGCERQE